jgi:hypothetical protein
MAHRLRSPLHGRRFGGAVAKWLTLSPIAHCWQKAAIPISAIGGRAAPRAVYQRSQLGVHVAKQPWCDAEATLECFREAGRREETDLCGHRF